MPTSPLGTQHVAQETLMALEGQDGGHCRWRCRPAPPGLGDHDAFTDPWLVLCLGVGPDHGGNRPISMDWTRIYQASLDRSVAVAQAAG